MRNKETGRITQQLLEQHSTEKDSDAKGKNAVLRDHIDLAIRVLILR